MNALSRLLRLSDRVLDVPYPDGILCMICGKPADGHWLCDECQEGLLPAEPMPGILSLYAYEGAAADAVRLLKFSGRTALARPLGLLMAALALKESKADLIVPVPLHWRRTWQRGYNQSALLAGEVAKHTGLPLAEKALARTRNTAPQARLDRDARLQNLQGAFTANEKLVRDRHILLVDDVTTTGATLAACTLVLLDAGAKRVEGLTACRTALE